MLFAAITVFIAVLFARGLGRGEIRSGLFTFGLVTGIATFGLWRRRRWARGVALVIALGNAGLGTLSLLSVIIVRDGPLLGPALLLVGSVALGIALSLRVFNFPDE
jgi:hypothetical protein